jgi:hypothetical protein
VLSIPRPSVASPYARLSDANAYMLMYRKISHSSSPTPPVQTVSTATEQHVGAKVIGNPALTAHSTEMAPLTSIPASISSHQPKTLIVSDAGTHLDPSLPLPATISPCEPSSSHPVATGLAIFSGVFPLDSEIPQYIRDDVIKMEEEALEKQRKIEASRNKLELKVFWKNSEKTVFISRRQTLYELFQTIWYQFALADEEDFAMSVREVVVGDPVSSVDVDGISVVKDNEEELVGIGIGIVHDAEEKGKNDSIVGDMKEEREVKEEKDIKEEKEVVVDRKTILDEKEGSKEESESKQSESVDLFRCYLFSDEAAKQMRLRFYNMSSKIATDVFDFSSLSKTLDTLNFSSYRYLILETKKQKDVFTVYFSDGFDVLLEEFDSDLKEFKEARTVRLPKEGTLLNLKGNHTMRYHIISYSTAVDVDNLLFFCFALFCFVLLCF